MSLDKEVQKIVDHANKAVKCPHCDGDIYPQLVACVPSKQTMRMKLTSETGAWSAKTIGGVITEFDKMLKAVARDVGGKVEVFIASIERAEKDLDIEFLITSVEQ